jgi:putative ABC transport system permease protein
MLFATAELGRSKARFGGLILGTGLLVFALLFQQALLEAVLQGMAGAIKRQSAPIIVFPVEAKRSLGAGLMPQPLTDRVASVPGVADTGPLGFGLFSYRPPAGGEAVNVSVIGYQPGRPGTPTGVREGRLPEAPDEIVASTEGALGHYRLGDTLVFEPGDVRLEVVGLTEQSLLNIGPALWVPWSRYEELTKHVMRGVQVVLPSVLAVTPRPSASVADLVKDINAQVPGTDAVTREVAADSAPGRQAIQGAFFSVMMLTYAVVGIVIGFFFLMITLQKEQSITMLRAVGASAGYLIRCLLLEVAIVMAGGVAVGVALIYLIQPVARAVVIIDPDPVAIAATAIPALGVALLGTLPPMRRMFRTDPNALIAKPSLGNVA